MVAMPVAEGRRTRRSTRPAVSHAMFSLRCNCTAAKPEDAICSQSRRRLVSNSASRICADCSSSLMLSAIEAVLAIRLHLCSCCMQSAEDWLQRWIQASVEGIKVLELCAIRGHGGNSVGHLDNG